MIVGLLAIAGAVASPATSRFPFAGGPEADSKLAEDAASRCRFKVRFEASDQGRVLIFLTDESSLAGMNCFSRWVSTQPTTGFQKYGFIGHEQH